MCSLGDEVRGGRRLSRRDDITSVSLRVFLGSFLESENGGRHRPRDRPPRGDEPRAGRTCGTDDLRGRRHCPPLPPRTATAWVRFPCWVASVSFIRSMHRYPCIPCIVPLPRPSPSTGPAAGRHGGTERRRTPRETVETLRTAPSVQSLVDLGVQGSVDLKATDPRGSTRPVASPRCSVESLVGRRGGFPNRIAERPHGTPHA